MLLQLGKRTDDIIDAYDDALSNIRAQTVDSENLEQRLQDVLHEMSLLNLKAGVYVDADDSASARGLEDEVLECIGKAEEIGGGDDYMPYLVAALKHYKTFAGKTGLDQKTVDLMLHSVKGMSEVMKKF